MSDQKAQRRVLFLQGMATSFFARLGEALVARGHLVHRINFNGGDRLFWSLPGAVDYRGSSKGWSRYFSQKLDAWRPTDIVLFGDCRPLHRQAIALAVGRGIDIHVIEEGYLRPNWITVERGGVNGHSALPRDIDWYLEVAQSTPAWTGGKPVRGDFTRRAVQDVVYNVTAALTWPLYWGYRSHRPVHPLVEYIGWVPRLFRQKAAAKRAQRTLETLLQRDEGYYFFPLQLDSDFQIRRHSNYRGMRPAIREVISSFAANAPSSTALVIKEHPLDEGLVNWRGIVRSEARRCGVESRVLYLEAGPIEPVTDHARGVVTVNSTCGFVALTFGKPTIALGKAIYDLPRLTFQGGLDAFWTKAEAPDAVAFDAFRRVVAARTQVNGGFFSTEGLELAVAGAVERIEGQVRGRASTGFEDLYPAAFATAAE